MNSLKHAIENLYITFGKYTTEGIHHCDCGCIKEEDVAKLNSKPLRELLEDDLVSYHGKALYTWGDIEHYKHYMPRILELLSINRKLSFIDLDEVITKLEYANWQEWDPGEVQAVKDYILADWIDFANREGSDIRQTELEAYSKYFELKDLIKVWDISGKTSAIRNFVQFFYYNGNQILSKGLKINESGETINLTLLMQSHNLTESLEKEFFRFEHTDEEYASRISVVLEMIEQQLKAEALNRS